MNSVEDLERRIISKRRGNEVTPKDLSVGGFINFYFDALSEADIYVENLKFKKMAIYQQRYAESKCISYNQFTQTLLDERKREVSCYKPETLSENPFQGGKDPAFIH